MKRLLILMVVWLNSLSAHAQPELDVELKAGPNASTVAEDNRQHRYGVSGGAGGYLQWAIDERFSLAGQMDLLYTPRGTKTVFEGEYLAQIRAHYFDIVLAARPAARVGPASLYVLAGAGLNLLLNAEKEEAAGAKLDITDGLHRVDVSLLVGGGVAMHLSGHKQGVPRLGTVFLELRHDHGLLDTDVAASGFKNRNTSLMLGLSFTLSSGRRTVTPTPPPPPPRDLAPPPPPTPSPDGADTAVPAT